MSIKCRQMYPLGPRANSLFSFRKPTQDGTILTYKFPNPFLLFGLAEETAIGGSATYGRFDWLNNTFQKNNYQDINYLLQIAFMYANRASDGGSADPYPGIITYQEVEAWGKFKGYFDNFTNPQLFDINYPTFIAPLEAMDWYWNNVEIDQPDADGYANPKLSAYELLCKLFGCGSDKRLWGTPGIYTIDLAGDLIAAGVSPLLLRVERNDICPHTTRFTVDPALVGYGVPTASYIWFEAGPGLPVDPGTVIAGDANVPYGGGLPNPVSLSYTDLFNWIVAAATDLGGFPPDMGTNQYDIVNNGDGTIDFIINSTIDGCVAPNFNGTLPGNSFTMNMKFTVPNPYLEQLRAFVEANGGPLFVTGEYMIPS